MPIQQVLLDIPDEWEFVRIGFPKDDEGYILDGGVVSTVKRVIFHQVIVVRQKQIYRRGWRVFHCKDCNYEWASPCRDRYSLTSEGCSRCREQIIPCRALPDPGLAVDEMGNLA